MIVGRRFLSVAVAIAAALTIAARADAASPPQPRLVPLLPGAAQNPTPVSPGASPAPVLPSWPGASFRTVDVPGAFGTLVDAVTNNGTVGGTYYTDQGALSRGFIEEHHQLTKFDYPGTSGVTSLDGMNSRGVAVGTYVGAGGTEHGWIRSADGDFSALNDPSAGHGDEFGTFPEGINGHGVIVGFYVDQENLAHGFLYNPASGFTTIDVPAAGTEPGDGTVLVSINNSGVIVGTYVDAAGVYHGVVDSGGSFVDFDAPGAGIEANQGTIAYGITRNGLISGWTLSDSNEITGWLLADWQFSALNDPLGATGPNLGSALYGINGQGSEAGGEYWDTAGRFHGYVAKLAR
ncbi:MAG TPA: hypothetical protein VMF07_14245 [Solirubrobacteraceae bacterium]|nr:hypothetical protein [Solirubrobacteraceae bacterium]